MRSKYDLKVILPRVLFAIVLAHCSLLFMQMAIDLNNALGNVALSLGGPLNGDTLPWSPSLSPPSIAALISGQDLFQVAMLVALVAAMAILVLAYVIRTALLNVLIVTAPVAALLSVMPDTRSHARTWLRLFLGTVFMQAVQLIILRVAVTTEFDSSGGVISTVRPGDAVVAPQGAWGDEHINPPREQGPHDAALTREVSQARADASAPRGAQEGVSETDHNRTTTRHITHQQPHQSPGDTAMINRVILVGNLTRDAEATAGPATTLTRMRIATNSVWRDAKGNRRSTPSSTASSRSVASSPD